MKKFAIFTLLGTVLVVSAGPNGLTLEDIRVQYPAVYEDFKSRGGPDAVFSTAYVREYNRMANNQKALSSGNKLITLEDIRVQYPAVYTYFKSSHPDSHSHLWSAEFVEKVNEIAANQKSLTGPVTSGTELTLEDVRIQYPNSYEEVKAKAFENPDRVWSIEEIESAGK